MADLGCTERLFSGLAIFRIEALRSLVFGFKGLIIGVSFYGFSSPSALLVLRETQIVILHIFGFRKRVVPHKCLTFDVLIGAYKTDRQCFLSPPLDYCDDNKGRRKVALGKLLICVSMHVN